MKVSKTHRLYTIRIRFYLFFAFVFRLIICDRPLIGINNQKKTRSRKVTLDFTLDQNWLIALIHRGAPRAPLSIVRDYCILQSTTFQHVHQSGKTHNLTAKQETRKIETNLLWKKWKKKSPDAVEMLDCLIDEIERWKKRSYCNFFSLFI